MKKLFLTLSLLVGMTALSSFTSSYDFTNTKGDGYWVTITTTCGTTDNMYIGGNSSISSIYEAAMVLESVFCD